MDFPYEPQIPDHFEDIFSSSAPMVCSRVGHAPLNGAPRWRRSEVAREGKKKLPSARALGEKGASQKSGGGGREVR